MINYYWVVRVFEIQYDFGIVDAFRIIIGKGMVNDYWILYLFEIISVFGM